jgi:dTDP-4-dehydrorhamnose 3,5-epimerase
LELEKTKIKECFILKPRIFEDDRGYFFESFNQRTFHEKTGLEVDFVQDNESYSQYGVIRGLHAQSGDFAQAKLVRVIEGEVLDVVVDYRPDSDTYLQHFSIVLTAQNKHQLFVPKGCLHGFAVLSERAPFFYKCDDFYNKESEIAVRYDDPQFQIDWKVPLEDQIVSEKDLQLPFLTDQKI